MSVEENKETVRRYIEEALNKGNLEVVDDCFSEDWVYNGPAEAKGPEGFKQLVTIMRTAFPDLHYTIDDMVGEGDKLVARCTMTGTFKGEFMSIPPTGNQLKIDVVYFYLFKDGKEVKATPFMDTLSFYGQLGISPPGQ